MDDALRQKVHGMIYRWADAAMDNEALPIMLIAAKEQENGTTKTMILTAPGSSQEELYGTLRLVLAGDLQKAEKKE